MMQGGMLFIKDPDSIEPQGFDWTAWLAEFATAELIVTSAWAVDGADASLTAGTPSIVSGSLKTQCVLSGGTLGLRYRVRNRITTTSGYSEDATFPVLVQNT